MSPKSTRDIHNKPQSSSGIGSEETHLELAHMGLAVICMTAIECYAGSPNVLLFGFQNPPLIHETLIVHVD